MLSEGFEGTRWSLVALLTHSKARSSCLKFELKALEREVYTVAPSLLCSTQSCCEYLFLPFFWHNKMFWHSLLLQKSVESFQNSPTIQKSLLKRHTGSSTLPAKCLMDMLTAAGQIRISRAASTNNHQTESVMTIKSAATKDFQNVFVRLFRSIQGHTVSVLARYANPILFFLLSYQDV